MRMTIYKVLSVLKYPDILKSTYKNLPFSSFISIIAVQLNKIAALVSVFTMHLQVVVLYMPVKKN